MEYKKAELTTQLRSDFKLSLSVLNKGIKCEQLDYPIIIHILIRCLYEQEEQSYGSRRKKRS